MARTEYDQFSLSKAINQVQMRKMNDLKLASMQGEVDRQASLKDIARTSTVPAYGEYSDPAQQMEGAPLPEGLQEQTGEQYDMATHVKKLNAMGETELGGKVQEMMGKMEKQQRDEFAFKSGEMSKIFYGVKDEQTYNERMDMALEQGIITPDKVQPYSQDGVELIQRMGQKVKDVYNEGEGAGGGSSEFERLSRKRGKGDLSEGDESRYQVLSGLKARPSTSPYTSVDIEGKATPFNKTTGEYVYAADAKLTGSQLRANMSDADKKTARVQKRTDSMRKEAVKGTEHFQSQRIAVNDAISAMDSGDNALADNLLNQVMSQVQDSNVRAFQMYSVFDGSYGNAAERVFNSISRFVSGNRTPEERKVIKDTLLKFKAHSDPAAARMRNKYRSLARDNKLRPFQVVPPDSPEDIRDAPGISQDDKLKALKMYYPGEF